MFIRCKLVSLLVALIALNVPAKAGIVTAVKMVRDGQILVFFGENHFSKIERTAPQVCLLGRYFATIRRGESLTLIEGRSPFHAQSMALNKDFSVQNDVTEQLTVILDRIGQFHKNIEVRGPSIELTNLKMEIDINLARAIQSIGQAVFLTHQAEIRKKAIENSIGIFTQMGVTPNALTNEMRISFTKIQEQLAKNSTLRKAILESMGAQFDLMRAAYEYWMPRLTTAASLADFMKTDDELSIDALKKYLV